MTWFLDAVHSCETWPWKNECFQDPSSWGQNPIFEDLWWHLHPKTRRSPDVVCQGKPVKNSGNASRLNCKSCRDFWCEQELRIPLPLWFFMAPKTTEITTRVGRFPCYRLNRLISSPRGLVMATPKKIPSAENGLNQNAVTKKKGALWYRTPGNGGFWL